MDQGKNFEAAFANPINALKLEIMGNSGCTRGELKKEKDELVRIANLGSILSFSKWVL